MQLRTLAFATGLLAATFAAGPALALEDLTGNWLGTSTCDSVTPTGSEKTKTNVALVVDDDPSGIAIVGLDIQTYRVAVLADPDAPAKGRLGGPDCNVSVDFGGRMLQLSVKAKDGSDKGTMQGELIITRTGKTREVSVCKLKLKRVSTTIADPMTDCPL